MELKLPKAHLEILDTEKTTRFLAVKKGRRFGATTLKMHDFILKAAQGKGPLLWVDTIQRNIKRYVEGIALPFLRKARIPYKWNSTDKMLYINDAGHRDLEHLIAFGSAERAENLEGFGYTEAFVNEAGIIFEGDKGKSLYENTLLPMLMDHDGRITAAGVPKGENHFATICAEWEDRNRMQGKMANAKVLQYSSYDGWFWANPEKIDVIAENMSPNTRAQEIDGDFINYNDSPYLDSFIREKHEKPCGLIEDYPIILSFDFNYNPMTCVVMQCGADFLHFLDVIQIHSPGRTQTDVVCEKIEEAYPGLNHYFIVTGDSSGRQHSSTSKVTAFEAIQKRLQLASGQMQYPRRNLFHIDSKALCDSVFYKFNVKLDPKCEVLIDECGRAMWPLKKDRDRNKFDAFDAMRYGIHYALPDFI